MQVIKNFCGKFNLSFFSPVCVRSFQSDTKKKKKSHVKGAGNGAEAGAGGATGAVAAAGTEAKPLAAYS